MSFIQNIWENHKAEFVIALVLVTSIGGVALFLLGRLKDDDNSLEKAKKEKKFFNMLLVLGMLCLEGALVWLILFIVKGYDVKTRDESIFYVIAMIIMIIWIGVMLAYLAWAIYFYNINHGLTNEDWAEIRINGNGEVPNGNPYKEETLGLPSGSVRGLMAITLMVGGFAMMIASLGKPNEHDVNKLFVDNLDFFKTAFLMMIAFYFGNKALAYLKPDVSTLKNKEAHSGAGNNTITPLEAVPQKDKLEDEMNSAFDQEGAQG